MREFIDDDRELMEPETPREFALVQRIRMLEKQLEHANIGEFVGYGDEGAPVQLARSHPPLIKAASLRAVKVSGRWRVSVRAFTKETDAYYEITDYFDAPEGAGWSTSSLLAEIHKRFCKVLAGDLVKRYGDIWTRNHTDRMKREADHDAAKGGSDE